MSPAEPRPQRGWFARHRWGVLAASSICACACVVWALSRNPQAGEFTAEIVSRYPHDAEAYTQGLAFHGGYLYEGTGQYGQSSLRRVELQTGRVLQSRSLDERIFGEGIAVWGDRIVQLTWKNQFGIVYGRESLEEVSRFRYYGEGWGLTQDGRHLIMSDGSPTLRFLDPQTYREVRRLPVRHQGRLVSQLNELEFVEGEILANIWYKDRIARIAPRDGTVTGWIDLSGLMPNRQDRDQVANGIAYDAEAKRLFVTGKNWPILFEVRLVRR